MIITWTHEDGTVEEASTEDLSAVEAAAIESCMGDAWAQVDLALRTQSPTAMRAVLWAFHKRSEPTLRFDDFDVPKWQRALKARFGAEEIRDMVERLRRDATEGDSEFESMLGYMRDLAHDPATVDKAVADTGPKAKGRTGRGGSAT